MGANSLLFSVAVEHEFFHGGMLRGLRVEPAPETAVLLRRPGLDYRADASGVRVIFDAQRLESLTLLAADGGGRLEFWFKGYAPDPAVAQCSEAFVMSPASIAHLDVERAVKDRAGPRRLHAKERVDAEDLIALDDPILDAVLDARDRQVRPLFTMRVQYAPKGRQKFSTRLRQPPDEYLVRFGARRTHWKYYLLGLLRARDFDIVDLDAGTRFEAMGEAMLADSRPAIAFRSREAIALRERPSSRFQLKEQGNGRILIRRLPAASAGTVVSEPVGEGSVPVSEIYVNG